MKVLQAPKWSSWWLEVGWLHIRVVGSKRYEWRANLPAQSTPGIRLLKLLAYHNSKTKTRKKKQDLMGSTEECVVTVGLFLLPLLSSFSLSLHFCLSCLLVWRGSLDLYAWDACAPRCQTLFRSVAAVTHLQFVLNMSSKNRYNKSPESRHAPPCCRY